MNSSDKGTTDIERYDLQPELPLLHGLIDHLDLTLVKQAKTNEEKVPYLLPMLGVDTSSSKLKASMLEIEETITTWPQLASGVILGGGICTDVCRRILLNQLHDSGRYFVDFEELISDKNKTKEFEQEKFVLRPSLQDEEMIDLIKKRNVTITKGQIDLSNSLVKEIVTAATMAPTGANIQPWKWIFYEKSLFLFFDDRYSAGLLDYGNTTTFVGLGAATENVVLKAHELGFEIIAEKENLHKDSKLICVYKFFEEVNPEIINKIEPHVCDELVKIIPERLTNRNIGKRIEIEKYRLEELKKIAQTIPGADLQLIYDEKILDEIKDVTAVMDRIRVTHKGGHKDFLAEIRWTPEEAKLYSNGVDLMGTVDLTPSELAGWRVIKDWKVVQHLNDWGLGKATEKIQRKSIAGSSAVGLLTMPKFDCNNFYEGGRAFQRIWLLANQDNISIHPASLSTLIFNTFNYGDKNVFPEKMRNEVAEMRTKFEKLFSIKESIGEVILFRFFIADPPKARSVRYPLEQVLKII
jgi:nitroreductase